MNSNSPYYGMRSDDGQQWWDGDQWQPVTATHAADKNRGMNRIILIAAGGFIGLLAIVGVVGALATGGTEETSGQTSSGSNWPPKDSAPAPTTQAPVEPDTNTATIAVCLDTLEDAQVDYSAAQDTFGAAQSDLELAFDSPRVADEYAGEFYSISADMWSNASLLEAACGDLPGGSKMAQSFKTWGDAYSKMGDAFTALANGDYGDVEAAMSAAVALGEKASDLSSAANDELDALS